MTLKVKLMERDLHMVFVSALEEVCPGSGFRVAPDGTITRGTKAGCGDYCDHLAACNLIDMLIAAEGVTTLEFSGFSNGFNEDVGLEPPSGSVFWKPDTNVSGENSCGSRRVRDTVILVHEMVHALQNQLNTLDRDDPNTEFDAIRGENQVRRELCEPMRVKRGDTDVPDYDKPYLNVKDQRTCGCGERRSPLDQAARDLRCAAHIALVCMLDRLDTTPMVEFQLHRGAEELSGMLGDVGPVVGQRIRIAEQTRSISPHAGYVHALAEESFARDPYTVCLEAVGLSGEYGALLVVPTASGGLNVVTNLLFGGGSGHFVSGPYDLLEYSFGADVGFVNRIGQIRYPAGLGGQPDEFGGAVQFLSLKPPGAALMNTALYGYRYPAFNGEVPGPEGPDYERWTAVNEVYGIVQELMSTAASDARIIASRDRG